MSSSLPKGKDGFRVEVMKEEDFDTCIDLAVQAFSTRNKAMMHLKVPRDVLRAEFKKEFYEPTKQGLGLVARDKSNDELAGFLFNVQQYPWYLPKGRGNPMKPLYDLGDEVYQEAIVKTPLGLGAFVRGAVFRVGAGGTADGYEGRGVGMLLRSACIPFAKSKGYFRRVWVETISDATFHIWTDKLKYHVRAEIVLKDWKPTKSQQIQEYGEDIFQDLDEKFVICEGIIDDDDGRKNCYDKKCCFAFILCAFLCKCTCCFKKIKKQDDNGVFEF